MYTYSNVGPNTMLCIGWLAFVRSLFVCACTYECIVIPLLTIFRATIAVVFMCMCVCVFDGDNHNIASRAWSRRCRLFLRHTSLYSDLFLFITCLTHDVYLVVFGSNAKWRKRLDFIHAMKQAQYSRYKTKCSERKRRKKQQTIPFRFYCECWNISAHLLPCCCFLYGRFVSIFHLIPLLVPVSRISSQSTVVELIFFVPLCHIAITVSFCEYSLGLSSSWSNRCRCFFFWPLFLRYERI